MSPLDRLSRYASQFNSDLWVLSIGWLIAALGFAVSVPFISIYFNRSLGLSTTQIGLFFAVMAVVRAVFQALGGEISDRVGRRLMLIHLPYYRTLTFLFLGFAIQFSWGFWAIAIILFFNFISGAVFITSIMAMVSDIVPPEKRLDGYAISRSAGNAGWAIGPAIAGLLAATSYASLFYFSAAVTLVSGFVFQRYLRGSRRGLTRDRFRLSDLLSIHQYPLLAWHGLLTICLYLVVAQLVMPLSVYVVSMVGMTESQLGWLLMLNGVMVVAFQVPITRMTERYHLTTLMSAGAVLYFIGYFFMGTFVGFWPFMLMIFIVTCGELVMSPATMTITSRMAPEGRTGRFMGIYGFFVTLGWSLGPLYGGYLLDQFEHDWSRSWIIISSLAMVAAVGYMIYGRRLPTDVNKPQRLFNDN